MYIFKLRVDTVVDEFKKKHKVYGIDVFKRVRTIPDIFFDKNKAKHFVEDCNKGQPADIHIDDVVYDALVDQ